MVAQPAVDTLLELHELLPLEESEVYFLIRVLLAAGPRAIVGSAAIMATALDQAVQASRGSAREPLPDAPPTYERDGAE
jgi:hypothetical protein